MNAPSKPSTQLPPDGSQPSLGAVLGDVTRDMSQLVRQEVELAKVELRQEAKKTGQTAGLFGAGGVAVVMVLLFLSFALWWGLANLMDQGWAALIVAGVWAILGAILLAVARSRMRQVRGPQQTSETVRQIPNALKGQSQP